LSLIFTTKGEGRMPLVAERKKNAKRQAVLIKERGVEEHLKEKGKEKGKFRACSPGVASKNRALITETGKLLFNSSW